MRFDLTDAAKADLRRALGHFEKTGPLIVVVASNDYARLLDNWICHIESLGLQRFLIVAMDEILFDKLKDAGFPAARCDFDGSAGDFWLQRMLIWQFIVYQGYDVIQSDIDAIWLRNPIPFFDQYSQFNFLCSQGTIHPVDMLPKWGFVLCTGLFRINTGAAAENFFSAMLAQAPLIRQTDDQQVMNHVLGEHGVTWQTTDSTTYPEEHKGISFSCYREVVTGECEELALRIGLLPHHEFPRLPGGNPGAYVKHVLRSGDSETRIDELRACGCWMLDHARPRLEP